MDKYGDGRLLEELQGFGLKMDQTQPVEEVTIAGNLKDMLLNISHIANDTYTNGSKYIGSILIEDMTIAAGR